ncbi:hypothetical protein NIES4072_56520 [Nostoc commune NIES-4072]|uniref:Uncharacterized protein n=1 Tax=Nostoc commune NIES-4072 TaxID=2005467 RepID=A0A2R5G0G6_NOSCO|nr:hypothetical protein NIES4070_34410 [Nostoc commune HK-02]GBG21963.1 hypothetical protein NIES4072_56520 [Nostoc commune NIES-4072]
MAILAFLLPGYEVIISLVGCISRNILQDNQKEKNASQLQLSRVNDNSYVLRLPV